MRIALAVVTVLCFSAAHAEARGAHEKTHYYRLDRMVKRFASQARAASGKPTPIVAQR